MMNIMTLNMWCYFDWENRKDNIVSLLKDQLPDIIALQEVQTNHAFSHFPQSDFIADHGDLKYRVFAPMFKRDDQIDTQGGMTQETSYGLAIVSKYPIISSESYYLKRHPDYNEETSVLFCKLNIKGTVLDVCNVHFGNSDLFSDLHLNEVMDLCEERGIEPIILGDFNNFNLEAYAQNRLANYQISSQVDEYRSMPKNDGTLDYIVVPVSSYKIKQIRCPDIYVSDHRALVANIAAG